MKYTVLAALFGIVQVQAIRFADYENVALKEIDDDSDVVIQIYDKNHPEDAAEANEGDEFVMTHAYFRPDPVQSPWSAAAPKKPAPTAITDGFPADWESQHLGYEREAPSKYDTDLFMKSLVTSYAIEGNNGDGTKNGHYFMTKATTEAAAHEVVGTHLKMSGAAKDAYIAEHLDKLWAHYDVNKAGYIEVERAAPLLRTLVGEVEAFIGLQ